MNNTSQNLQNLNQAFLSLDQISWLIVLAPVTILFGVLFTLEYLSYRKRKKVYSEYFDGFKNMIAEAQLQAQAQEREREDLKHQETEE